MTIWERLFGTAAIGLCLMIGGVKYSVAYEGGSVESGGALSGSVKLKGSAPANQVSKVIHNPDVCGTTVEDQAYVINSSNRGIENVLVSIEGISTGKKAAVTTLILNNKKCHFVPHVLAGMPGDSVEIRNLDPVLHNTHLKFEGNTYLNVVLPPNGKNIKKEIKQAGTIKIKCDAHTFMNGVIYVQESPYFSITDSDGNFQITDIPPGKYKVRITHEGLPSSEKEVTIGAGEKKSLSVELSAK